MNIMVRRSYGSGKAILTMDLPAIVSMFITLGIAIFGLFPGLTDPKAIQDASMIFFFSAALLYVVSFIAGFGHELLRMKQNDREETS